MKTRTPYFPLGSSYYPPFHTPEDWERDSANMATAGLNMIRTAELLATWDYIEPYRGRPEWTWLDRIFELAGQNGIQILLGTGSCNPPIWMLEQYPDLQRISREGTPYPTNTVWGWACVNHPGLRNEVQRYINLLIDRFGANPALFGWQIDNEIGHHIAFTVDDRRGPRKYAYYCYCRHCARLFREWLERKYREIEALNQAWAWDPTHHRYYDWHQIQPPRSMPVEWGNGTAWLDFRRFVHDSFTAFIRFQHELLKTRVGRLPTVTNLFSSMTPQLGAKRGLDHWMAAGVADVIGYDMYPSYFKKDPTYTSWFLDFAYSVARHNQRPLWITELESGPIEGYSTGPLHATRPQDIKRYNLACLGHGAKMILYQGYRDWNCIPLHWGALVDFHGDLTPRYQAAADVARVVKQNEAFFLNCAPACAQVAILHSQDNVAVIDGQANESFLYRALRGVYNALWQKGFAIDFVAPQFIGGPTANYKAILLPFYMLVPQSLADALTAYVMQGGTVIGFAKLGHLDDRGWAWSDRPGAGLNQLFGARETNIEVFEDGGNALQVKVEPDSPLFAGINAATVNGYWHRQTFALEPDVDVLARFVDGAPAVIGRRHGSGQAILVATHLDIAVMEHQEEAAKQLLANLVGLAGVQRHVEMSGADTAYIEKWLDAHLLELSEQRMALINNEGDQAVDVTVHVPRVTHSDTAVELFSGASVALKQSGGVSFSIHIPQYEGVVVMLA